MDDNKIFSVILVLGLFAVSPVWGEEVQETDSVVRNIYVDEIVVSADPKSNVTVDKQPVSYTVINRSEMERLGINSLKDASRYVPNLFMPDYGSKLTSAIYIRGVGSRINTPAVGLYVDNVAYTDKSSFDVSLMGAENIEVLRGPQSTLYGRNSMGGLIKVNTRDPFMVQGTDVKVGLANASFQRKVQFISSHMLNDRFAFYVAGFYEGSNGYNKHSLTGYRTNGYNYGGGKLRGIYKFNDNLKIDLTASYEYDDEDGYDYVYTGIGNDAGYKDYAGLIAEGEQGGYRRNMFNAGINIEYLGRNFIFNSITGYQYLSDRMKMDQDFSPMSIFTLAQKQKINNISEELSFKSRNASIVDWTAGAYVSYQSLKTDAPVCFGADGVDSLIQGNINKAFDRANAAMAPMGMSIGLDVLDDEMTVDGTFDTPTLNTAVFGQAAVKNLLFDGFDVTVGLRLDYESMSIDYRSGTDVRYRFQMKRGGYTMIDKTLSTSSYYIGNMRDNYLQVLPKLAFAYRFDEEKMVYLSISKGFRSGGYNIQMFSDLIQESLKNDMMKDLGEAVPPASSFIPAGTNPSADSATVYKPEVSWNYEIGTHLDFFDRHLTVEAAVFYQLTRDQQIARYAESGLGRMMVNAGKSESFGLDLSFMGRMNFGKNIMLLKASYGYVHAVFKEYDGGVNDGESYDYAGNYVPFTPMHNFAVTAEYVVPFRDSFVKNLTFGAQLTGTGRIYWTEKNDVSQQFYALLGAHATVNMGTFEVDFWGKNLTDNDYVPFYFESMGKGFAQVCKPMQCGVDVILHF